MRLLPLVVTGICAVGATAGSANAQIIGSAYFVPEAQAQNAVIGFSHGAPTATFSVPNGPINFTNAGVHEAAQITRRRLINVEHSPECVEWRPNVRW